MPALFLFFLLLSPLLTIDARADLGPKPVMEFHFSGEEAVGKPTSAQLLQCNKPDCSDGTPLLQNGPQAFSCLDRFPDCHALAYGFKPFNQLALTFSDRVRRSNVFSYSGKIKSLYQVTIRADDLELSLIDAQGDFPKDLNIFGAMVAPPLVYRNGMLALAVTILTELLVLTLWMKLKREKRFIKAMVGWTILTSMTFCILYLAGLAFPIFGYQDRYWYCMAVAEGIVVLTEGVGFYGWMGRKVAFRSCLLLSLAANVASFLWTFVF